MIIHYTPEMLDELLSIHSRADSWCVQVTEVTNGDALVVKLADGTAKKIFLSSIRSPR